MTSIGPADPHKESIGVVVTTRVHVSEAEDATVALGYEERSSLSVCLSDALPQLHPAVKALRETVQQVLRLAGLCMPPATS